MVMELNKNMITSGNYFFKYRGQFPVLMFIISFPIILQTHHYNLISETTTVFIQNFAITIGFIGLLVRYYTVSTTPKETSGKNRTQQVAKSLNTQGMYSIVRNPLYLANYMIWSGIAIYSLSYILLLIINLIFILYYERIIMAEEYFLTQKFEKKYIHYCNITPAIIPKFRLYKKSLNNFSFKKLLREEYSATLSTIVSFLYIDCILNMFCKDQPNKSIQLPEEINTYITIITISSIILILLKIAKKMNFLKDED